MKHTTLLLPALLAMAAAANVSAAAATKSARPLIPLFTAEQVGPHCDAGLAALAKRVAALEKMPKAKNSRAVFAKWDDLAVANEDFFGPLDHLKYVVPDTRVVQAMDACLIKVGDFNTKLGQNKKLYQLLKATVADNVIDAKLRQDALNVFEDSGVSLPAAKQVRFQEIFNRLTELKIQFDANVVADTKQRLAFTPDEVKGLPESYLKRAQRDDKGNYLLSFASPDYTPFMENSEHSEARKRYQIGYENRGSPKNIAILNEATGLRRELAGLFGIDNFADYVQRRRMAGNSTEVTGFLGAVRDAVTEVEKKEVEQLRVFKSERLKTALADTTLPRWDQMYWQEQYKKANFNIDQNVMRKYFPTEAAVPWMLEISARLYGVKFEKVKVATWHEDVRYYDVIDAKSGQQIAGIYLDLFPRDNKYGHAAVWNLRGGSTLIGRKPIAAMATNFDRTGLDVRELETLVHEFGHVMHGVLSATRYVRHAGTNTETDFVEAPSQMYEEWARNKESLALLANFCQTACPQVDDALLSRLKAARNYGQGIRYARQLLLASIDMAIHGKEPADALAAWQKLQGATPLGYIPGTHFPGQFGHLMNGYEAGYYGYMWSEVMALDMLSAFGDKLMNPEVGMRYRKEILGRGGEMRGGALVHNFLGRSPNPKAFFDEITGQRSK